MPNSGRPRPRSSFRTGPRAGRTSTRATTVADGDDVGSSNNLDNVSDAIGLAYIGTTMYVTESTGAVRGTTLAANMPELTVTGDYTASLSATWTEYPSGYDVSGPGYSSSVVSADVDFSLDKVTEVVIT